MAANTVTKARAYSGSQAGQFVDTITFTDSRTRLMVDNRTTAVDISLTIASSGTAATPAVLGDDTYFVPAGGFRAYSFEQVVGQVKLVGHTAGVAANGMAYTVAVV